MKEYYIVIGITLLAGAAAFFFEPTGWLCSMSVAFLVSFMMMYYATWNILEISYRKKLFDIPDKRRIHKTPTSRLGGFAFAPILISSAILAIAFQTMIASVHTGIIPNCLLWICALIFIHAVGTIDDLIGVRNTIKLSAQILASVTVVASGFWINDLYGLFGIHAIPAAVGMPLTALFIVFIINAYNLIDGMDGLAAGLAVMAFIIYGVRSYFTGHFVFSIISCAILGALVPFLYANVRGLGPHRHKLFMGDTGSQTIGLIVTVLAIGQTMNMGTTLTTYDFAVVFSPMLVPAFDVAHVVLFRLLRGRNPFRPDMTHIHHRVLKGGFSSRQAVVIILSLAVFLFGVNVLLAPYINVILLIAIDVALWCGFNGLMSVAARKKDVKHKGDVRGTASEKELSYVKREKVEVTE